MHEYSEVSINLWKLILQVCEVQKSEECWIISELSSDYLLIDEGPLLPMELWHEHCNNYLNVLKGEPLGNIEEKPLMYVSVDDIRQIIILLNNKVKVL